MSDVNYTKRNWENSPSTNTPISAENLGAMDQGISDCAAAINSNNTDITNLKNNLKANNNDFVFDYDGTDYGYKIGNTFHPFKKPTGTKSITANGTYDVTDYASANVNISGIVTTGTLVATFPIYDPGAGQERSFVFTASSAGLYLAVGINSAANNPDMLIRTFTMSTTGTQKANAAGSVQGGQRSCYQRICIAQLSVGQTITGSAQHPVTWGFTTMMVFKIG